MTRLRRVLAAAGPAVLAGALAAGCSGPGVPARPPATGAAPPSATTAPGTTPAPAGSCHAGVSGAENWIMGSG